MIRKGWNFDGDQWSQVQDYTKNFYLSSSSEAVRILIARGLKCNERIDDYRIGDAPLTFHTIPIPKKLAEKIKLFQTQNNFKMEIDTVRTLIKRGIEAEKKSGMI